MPFTHRDKPKLADRLRGKSGEEILNELKSDLDPEGRMFFDSPSWRTRQNNMSGFPRGFPFDDDRNRANIRTYLDEIATRHPEFADQLKEPPWGEDYGNIPFGRKRRGSETGKEEEIRSEPSGSSQAPPKVQEPRQNLTNFGLRNTVPLGPGTPAEEDRHHRSMSAPPDNKAADKPKRFVTKCEIPVMNDPKQDSNLPKSDLPKKGEQSQPKANNAPNVRVIPIQVEGRDTPIVNTNVDTATNFGAESFKDTSFEGRLPRDFGSYQRHSPRFAHKERAQTPPQYQYAPQYQQYGQGHHFVPPHQQQFMPQQQQFPPSSQSQVHGVQFPQRPPAPPPSQQQQPQPQQYHQQHQPQPQQYHQQQQPQQQAPQQPQSHPQAGKIPQGDETDSRPPPQPKPEPVKDPIEKVQVIQKEVEELMKQVEAFKGNSRTDKHYLMLDELLTRQLLLLDNINTEGKENVRQARKDAIRSIQRCISTLENKVPVQENTESTLETNASQEEEKKAEEQTPTQAMDVDQTKEGTPVQNKENQVMEVDDKGNKDAQAQQQQNLPEQQQLELKNKEKV